MLTLQIGLVAETNEISPSVLHRVAAALQKQVTRDFGPIWNVQATVNVFPEVGNVPPDCWPLVIKDDVEALAEGFHVDEKRRPSGVVKYAGDWTMKASHECLEMLADPFGNRVVPGPSLKSDQGLVEYLVEVCDPCQLSSYKVDGFDVSNFCTPNFFDASAPVSGGYTFIQEGCVSAPLHTMDGGYLAWCEPGESVWWQAKNAGGVLDFERLGFVKPGESPREAIAMLARNPGPVDAAEKPDRLKSGERELSRRPEFYHLLYRLATDDCFRKRFETAAREVYLEYGIDIPQELLPYPVTLPEPELLKNALLTIDSSLGVPHVGEFGAPYMSTCGFVSVP